MTRKSIFLWGQMLLSLLVAAVSLRFLLLGLDAAFPDPTFAIYLETSRLAFATHVFAAPLALALGAWQFVDRQRRAPLGRHRLLGRLYVAAIAAGGASALVLTLDMGDRPLAALGMALLAVFWLSTTTIAVRHARRGDLKAHSAWMIRSFALTTAAVTLRLYLLVFVAFGYDYYAVSPILAWISWVPNWLLAEWYLSRATPKGFAATRVAR